MSENWNEILQNEPIDRSPRPGFEAELRAGLSNEWNGRPITTPTTAPSNDRSTRRGWLLGAAAAAILVIGGVVVATRPDGDSTVQTPVSDPETSPTAAPTVATTDSVVVPSPDTTIEPSTTTEATSTTSATTAPPDDESPIPVPLDATEPLPLQPIATVENGPGDKQVEVLNGEFPPPAVLYVGGVLVLEDAPETGLTGDGVIVQTGPDSEFDDGTQQRISPVTIDVAEPGGTPIGVRSLDGGGVVVVTAHTEQPPVRIRQYSQNPPGQFTEVGNGADRSGLGDSELGVTSEGATWGGDVVIPPSGSNPDAARAAVTSDPPFGVFSEMAITRPEQDGEPAIDWTLDIEIDLDWVPGSSGPQVEPFGDGALATFTNSSSPISEPAFVVLDSNGGGMAYDLDGWSVADVRPDAALLTKWTPEGLELATVTPASFADPTTTTSIEPGAATTIEPVDSVAAWSTDCVGQPFAPPFLRNGEPVGEPALVDLGDPDLDDDQLAAIWAQGTDNEVIQLLDSAQEDGFAIAADFDEVLVSDQFEAAVVPLGPPTAPINIDIRDVDQTCTRQYSVPATSTEDEADSYAAQWIEALNQ